MPVEDEVRELREVVQDAVSYPILTREAHNGVATDTSSGPAGRSSLTSTAQTAIRDLLGWRFRANDPKGFVSALTKAVDLKEAEGHVDWTWVARPYMAQADMGEVTGAQASIYSRAKAALDQVIPLLEKLKPASNTDSEQAESMRAIVRSAWSEMVNELCVVTGPRLERIDQYLIQLVGTEDPADLQNFNGRDIFAEPEHVGGALGTLRDRFGLDRNNVLTVGAEQNFTDFLIIVDQTTGFVRTWDAQKPSLARNAADPFLGTQLVRISQDLAVMVESVHEMIDALEAINIGAEERQTMLMAFPTLVDVEDMTVAELFDWIERFATVEARQLIADCGRDGVENVTDTLEMFENMLNDMIEV